MADEEQEQGQTLGPQLVDNPQELMEVAIIEIQDRLALALKELDEENPLPRPESLYRINETLWDLAILYAELPDMEVEAKAALEVEILAYIKKQIKKADGIAYVWREHMKRAETLKELQQRIYRRRKSHERAAEKVKAWALTAMLVTNNPRIEGEENTLRVTKNPASVSDNIQMNLLPRNYQKVTITMNAADWDGILADYDLLNRLDHSPAHILPSNSIARTETAEPLKDEIKKELKRKIPCECRNNSPLPDAALKDCPDCGGSGMRKGKVPGASLIEDAVRLDIL